MPTYNRASYLARSISSVIEQTLENWELIIVDDASTDETPQVLEKFSSADPRITVVRNQENSGLPGSLNVGFSRARGIYLSWTSDDNMYRPNALAVMVSALQANERVDLVYAGVRQVDENGNPIGYLHALPPSQISNNCVVHACFLYRRKLQEALGGYRNEVHFAEDYDFWLRAFCRFKFQAIDEDLYLYTTHAQSMSSEQERVQTATEKALLDVLPELQRANSSVAAGVALRLSRMYLNGGRRLSALAMMFRAFRIDPQTAMENRKLLFQLVIGTRLTEALAMRDVGNSKNVSARTVDVVSEERFRDSALTKSSQDS
jgi:hypothetical protein